MKLKDIFEIKLVPEQPLGIPQYYFDFFDLENPTQVGTVEGLPLYEYFCSEYPTQKMYRLYDGDNVVISVIGIVTAGSPNDNFKLNRTMVGKEYQGKGYAKAVYDALFSRLRYNLFSDQQLTNKTLAAWKKGWSISHCFMYVYSYSKNKYFHIDEVENLENDEDLVFCLLHTSISESKLLGFDYKLFDTIGAYVRGQSDDVI